MRVGAAERSRAKRGDDIHLSMASTVQRVPCSELARPKCRRHRSIGKLCGCGQCALTHGKHKVLHFDRSPIYGHRLRSLGSSGSRDVARSVGPEALKAAFVRLFALHAARPDPAVTGGVVE